MRLRTRIFLAVLLLASAVFFPLFLEVNAEVAAGVQAAASSELERAAYLVASEVGGLPFSDSVADALGQRVGARVSLIDRSGRVLGDSEVPARRLRELDDDRSRPEVAAALAGEAASSTRASRTIARLLLYVAVPHPQGAVRLAVPAQAGESSVARVRRLMILAWAMALLLGLAVGAWIEARLQASVTATADALDRVAAGDVDTPHAGAEGLRELARAFERMRGGVRERPPKGSFSVRTGPSARLPVRKGRKGSGSPRCSGTRASPGPSGGPCGGASRRTKWPWATGPCCCLPDPTVAAPWWYSAI